MKLAALVIIALSHQGYWFGNQEQSISLRPAIKEKFPEADRVWEITLDDALLGRGKSPISNAIDPARIQLKLPESRTRVSLRWKYRIIAHNGDKELEKGAIPLYLFPNDLTAALTDRLQGKRLVVWASAGDLTQLLERAKIPFTRVDSEQKLQFLQADIILVGENRIRDGLFDSSLAVNLAKSGASVIIFRQSEVNHLLAYHLEVRNTPVRLDWRMDHPLLSGFTETDLQSLVSPTKSLKIMELPLQTAALVLAAYPPEVPALWPEPTDAVLLTQSIGKGRIVLCQLPLGDWLQDPRSQMFFANAIDYLLTRPQPTPGLVSLPAPTPGALTGGCHD